MIDPAASRGHAVRRALARADAGKTLNAAEATVLLGARGEDLDRLTGIAARVRDQAFGDRITYSRKVFIPLTHLGRDTCGYCTFAWPPADYSRIEPHGIRYRITDATIGAA